MAAFVIRPTHTLAYPRLRLTMARGECNSIWETQLHVFRKTLASELVLGTEGKLVAIAAAGRWE
jgi:hypothetical protein